MADRMEVSGRGAGSHPDDAVPVIRWGPETVERRDLFDAWHEIARPLFDTSPAGDPGRFSGGGMAAKMGDMLLTEVHFTAQRFDRTRRHLADNDSFSVQLYTRGGIAGTSGDMPYRLAPGRIAMFDFGREHRSVACEPSVVLGASLPRTRLDTSGWSNGPAITWSTDSTAGRLLGGALKILREDMDKLTPAEAAEAAEGFIGLVNGLLRSRRAVGDPRPVQQLCLATIERYVEQHLHRPDLDTAALCRAFGSSRSRLYDLFRIHGGVERYLRERRLGRCFAELAAAAPATGRIGRIAERWGFFDPSHFNRLFKQRFGMRPSDVLASHAVAHPGAQRPAALAPSLATAHQWIRSL